MAQVSGRLTGSRERSPSAGSSPVGFDPGRDFTVQDVLAWARTKPADEAYDYTDFLDCALCQFLKETGRAVAPSLAGNDWYERHDSKNRHKFDGAIDQAADMAAATFGKLVTRLEALCPPSEWTRLDSYMTDELVNS